MTQHDTFLAELRSLAGHAAVYTGDAIAPQHLSDWSGTPPVQPLALVCPGDTATVSRVLALCHTHRVPVVPQGGLTGLCGGAVPVSGGIALSLARMNRIDPVDTLGATLTVQAGATLQAVQDAAAAAGFLFGMDLGARGSCQIGGNLATNAGGNGVVQHGMMREQTLGLEVVLADGTVLPMLRPMLKNNTGCDLKHVFIGSEGTLGIITQAVLTLRPAAPARQSVLVALPDFAQAVALLRRLQAAFPGALAAFELMWEDFYSLSVGWSGSAAPFAQAYPFAALADITGTDDTELAERVEAVLGSAMADGLVLDAVLAQSPSQARALWRIREATAEFPTRLLPINFDISLPLAQMDAFANDCIAALSQRWPDHHTVRFGHLGDGNLHLTTDARSLTGLTPTEATHEVEQLVYGLLARRGGSVSAEHGIGLHKKPYLSVSRTPAELATLRAIKQALDPLNLLNPGKVFDATDLPLHNPAPKDSR
jgi:FAD/FMN-containing dehydrogenase